MEKYNLIANDVRKKILEGFYKPNEQLPFERDFCEYYNVSKMTVKKALDILVAEGLIYKRRGAGTFVMDLPVEKMEKMLMDIQMMGTTAFYPDKTITSRVMDFSVVKATPEIADKLKIKETSFVYKINRVRFVNDKPTVIEETYMPIDLITGLRLEQVEHSIYDYIENDLGLKIQSGHRTITVRRATDTEAHYLDLESGDPVAVAVQTGYLNTGVAFEYSISKHRYDEFSVEIVLTHN